jgi:hypothetical protein
VHDFLIPRWGKNTAVGIKRLNVEKWLKSLHEDVGLAKPRFAAGQSGNCDQEPGRCRSQAGSRRESHFSGAKIQVRPHQQERAVEPKTRPDDGYATSRSQLCLWQRAIAKYDSRRSALLKRRPAGCEWPLPGRLEIAAEISGSRLVQRREVCRTRPD